MLQAIRPPGYVIDESIAARRKTGQVLMEAEMEDDTDMIPIPNTAYFVRAAETPDYTY